MALHRAGRSSAGKARHTQLGRGDRRSCAALCSACTPLRVRRSTPISLYCRRPKCPRGRRPLFGDHAATFEAAPVPALETAGTMVGAVIQLSHWGRILGLASSQWRAFSPVAAALLPLRKAAGSHLPPPSLGRAGGGGLSAWVQRKAPPSTGGAEGLMAGNDPPRREVYGHRADFGPAVLNGRRLPAGIADNLTGQAPL
jgi:hypothetical protein